MRSSWIRSGALSTLRRGDFRRPRRNKSHRSFWRRAVAVQSKCRFPQTAELRRYMHTHGLLGPGAALVTHGFESQGVMPEYFPAGYDDFIMDVTSAHPQMMALFTKLFGDRSYLTTVLCSTGRSVQKGGDGMHISIGMGSTS